jgi:EEF1A lysine methyltransferase 2
MATLTEHWNNIYETTEEKKLGWYEDDFSQILDFLNQIPKQDNTKLFISGVGRSALPYLLLKSARHNQQNIALILNDLSSEIITSEKEKYSKEFTPTPNNIQWLCQDISQPLPSNLTQNCSIDIWIDRAVLHFLIDETDINEYFKNINKTVKVGGYALFAEFSKDGATQCAGLDVTRYDVDMLQNRLSNYELIKSQEYLYINPNKSPRPYIYTLFQRKL